MERVWDDFDGAPPPAGQRASALWPRIDVADVGAELKVSVDVPGMAERDLELTLSNDSLAIRGERRLDVPEGYSVHRQERGAMKFSRTVPLPCKVESEKASASLRDGVLTISLAKAAEDQPRQIPVRAR